VDYSKLVAPLIESVKALKAENERLRAKLEQQGTEHTAELEQLRAEHNARLERLEEIVGQTAER
jgi:regulator of replication initiation timing